MIEMNIKLTKAQSEIAEWAIDAAPEETTDPVEEPLYIVGEHPTMIEPDVLYIGSTAWAGDFLYRVEIQYVDMAHDEFYEGLELARIVRSSMALGKKVRAAFPDAVAG